MKEVSLVVTRAAIQDPTHESSLSRACEENEEKMAGGWLTLEMLKLRPGWTESGSETYDISVILTDRVCDKEHGEACL